MPILTVLSPTCLTRQFNTADCPTIAVTFLAKTSSKNGFGELLVVTNPDVVSICLTEFTELEFSPITKNEIKTKIKLKIV